MDLDEIHEHNKNAEVKVCYLDACLIDDEEPVLYEDNYYHSACAIAVRPTSKK